jgi:hypothetical protein
MGVYFPLILPEVFILISWPIHSLFPSLEIMEIWKSEVSIKTAVCCFKTSLENIKNSHFEEQESSECMQRGKFFFRLTKFNFDKIFSP